MRKIANLRVCASCEWIFKGNTDCPQCEFGSYGARYVYGDKCYQYAKTQKPWMDKKIANYSSELFNVILDSQPKKVDEFAYLKLKKEVE